MIDTLRSEWIKLRTVRMNWVLAIAAFAFPVLITTAMAAFSGGSTASLNAEDVFSLLTFTSVVTAILLGVIGATTITGEFGFNTIRPTFAATPRRGRVIAAKAIITVLVAVIVEALVIAVTVGVTKVVAEARGKTLDYNAVSNLWPPLIGLVVLAGIVSLLGLGLGLIIRSTPAAVAVLILWLLIVENIITLVLAGFGIDNAGKWMPYTAGVNLGNPNPGDASLGRLASGLYFGGVTMIVVLIGAAITRRRDA